MICISTRIVSAILALLNISIYSMPALSQAVDDLTLDQRRELTLFGIRSLGVPATLDDVKEVQSGSDLETMISTGLNLNELLCAQIDSVHALQLTGKYEVVCIAYRGGAGTKTYVVDALNGTAFEQ